MGNRTHLYVVCLVLFPLAFAACVVGFGCPVWVALSNMNSGLWQSCETVFKNCSTFSFDDGGDWMIGVRAVEIFALVMLTVAAVDIAYENCCTNFRGRQMSERLAPGLLCIIGGLGGHAGIIVYAVKINDEMSGHSFGWALALVAAGSGLAVILGVGFCVSGLAFENKQKKHEKSKSQINGRNPYLTSNEENYEMNSYTNKAMHDERGNGLPQTDSLPGFAMYNGMLNRPGTRSSLPVGPTTANVLPPFNNSRLGPPTQPKSSQYYSLSDDRVLDPSFDLSEGYQPTRGRPSGNYGRSQNPYSVRRDEDPYARGGRGDDTYLHGSRSEDPYSRGGRGEDPYARVNKPPRAGYNDPFGFDRPRGDAGTYDRAPYIRGNDFSRDSRYNRPTRF